MSKSEGYKKIESLLSGGAAQVQSSPSSGVSTPAAAPAASRSQQKSAGYQNVVSQLAAGAQSLGRGNGGTMLSANWDDWNAYRNAVLGQQKQAKGYLSDLLAQGYSPSSQLYQSVARSYGISPETQARQVEAAGEEETKGDPLNFWQALGAGAEAGLWQSAKGMFNLGAAKVGEGISSPESSLPLGLSAAAEEQISNYNFKNSLKDIWSGYQPGDKSLRERLKDMVFTSYHSAFQNLLEGRGRTSIPNSKLDSVYKGASALFYTLKNWALPNITGSDDPEENAKWLTEKAYGAADKAEDVISSWKPLQYVDSEKLQKDLSASSKPAAVAGNVAQVVANMLPSIAASYITQSPDTGLIMMAASAAGSAAEEAMKNGATAEQAYYIGLEKGYVEYMSEGIFDAIGAFGGGKLSPTLRRLLGDLALTKFGRAATKLFNIAGENVEEAFSDWASPGIEKAVTGDTFNNQQRAALGLPEEDDDISFLQALSGQAPWTEQGLVTLLSTLVLGGMSSVVQNNIVTVPKEQAQEIVQIAKNSGNDALAALATEYEKILDRRGKIGYEKFKTLYEATESRLGAEGMQQAFEAYRNAENQGQQQGAEPTQAAQASGATEDTEDTGAGAAPVSARAYQVPEYESIEAFSGEFDNPESVTAIYEQNPETDVNEFAAGFRAAYDMGQSGVSARNVTEQTAPGLTEAQRTAAYDLGRSDAQARAAAQGERITAQKQSGNLKRAEGTVKGEGVTMAELRETFNDPQNTAYRVLSKMAKLTGVNVVLYRSQADENGNFPSEQGRFQWRDDTIYIDLNAGLENVRDAADFGRYTMLRIFDHEFTHFIEKYNAEAYNVFREYVFSVLEARGENVHDLIEAMQARDASGSMSYEQASREVLADSMMDILQDSTLAQQLAQEHPTVFKQLLTKLKQFVARIKQAFRDMSTAAPREAQALKEGGAYLDGIVKAWDEIAKGAVENYQSVKGEAVTEQAAEQVTGKKEKAAVSKASEQVVVSSEASEASKAEAEQPKTRQAGMEFFKPVESTAEEAPDLRQAAAQRNQPVGRERFPANDLTSRAEAGPDLKGMVPRAPAQEQAAVEETAPAVEENPAAVEKQDTPEGAKLRAALDNRDEITVNGFRYAIFGMNNTTLDMQKGGTSTGTEYWGTIARVSSVGVPVQDARTIFNRMFDTREEAVDYMVSVAENNNLLKEAPTNGESESETPAVRAENRDRRDGRGTVSVSPELQERDVQGAAAERGAPAVSEEARDGAGRHGDRSDAERNGRGRSEGTGESGVQRGRAELTPEQVQEKQEKETHAAVEHDVKEKSTVHEGGDNFVIGDNLDLPRGQKARYKANVEAIRLVKELEAEKRVATPEEQAVLSKYVGWGGIPEAFDEKKSEWSKEYAELKDLLTEDEYNAARGSTLNAHYTSIPVIKAMYAGLKKLGFRGGRMLEPSSGVGNFVGAMPVDMSANVRSWTMVELDNITGLIAKHLYPQADMRIEGFEKAIIPDNFMDVAIGNVPFGNYPVVDRAYPKKLTSAIHNYFFAKSLDKVRPGGLVMFITSSYTMNSQDATIRRYIAKNADLLGAIRLPNNAFSGNAGTEVVTDILVLKKRAPGTEYNGIPFENADYNWNLGTYQNEYFTEHPDMVLGEQVKDRNGMYRRESYTVNPYTDRGTLQEQIEKAFDGIEVVGGMDYAAKPSPEKTNFAVERAEKGTKQGGLVNKDGKIYRNNNGTLVQVEADEKTARRITGMLQIRDLARTLLNAQMQEQTPQSIEAAREALNKAYDSFVKENGYLNSQANRKAFADDPDRFSLYALEKWDSEKKTATKADIFKENTVRPNRTVTHVDSVAEGVIVSRNTTGGIDVPMISRLTGKSAADVTRELIDSEQAFKDRDGNLLPAEVYLAGNVRAKLREAQGLVGIDRDYQHNIDALKQVVPADVPHEAIFVQPGAPWIPDTVYADFAAYILGGSNYRGYGGPDIVIHRSNETGNFTVELKNQRLKVNYLNTQKWGTSARSFLNLLDAMLNSRSVTVSRKGEDGKSYVDDVATAAAKAKVDEITKEFQRWLWEDGERTKDLEYLYNETFNALVTPKYDGSKLTINGLRAGWSLKAHQADAVQRVISSGGNTLLAHRVGAGKTMEMAAAAMKLKELGIVKKPMFAVPKSLVAQWGKEFMSYFPTAKLLVAEQGDFTPANRKTFANRISTGSYDAVIVSYEQFEKIPMSDDFTLQMYQAQVNEIIQAIEEQRYESGQKSLSVKDLEKKRKQLEAKIQKLADKPKDADAIEFEQLGIDSLFVDEAHNFKNLWYTTSMQNVAGLGNKDGSKRAFDLYTKVRYLQQLNGGRGIVFATATPVMNSMSEMYIMQRYLQPDLLDQLGLSTFDAWAKQFGEVVNAAEVKPSGQGVRVKQKFSRFKNVGELQQLFRNFADVLTDVPGLEIPKMKGGKVQIIESEPSEFQQEYMKELQKRADNIKNVDPSKDNMLKITSDGRKISYTQRMIDPSLPYEENCKIYQCADKVLDEYKASKAIKGTQLIFLDMATPKGKTNSEKAAAEEETLDGESARLYDDLKARLVKKGIPAKEIAFIHDADTDAKKSKLFDDVNDGKVRVLIGSTGKMGVGMNAQKRVVAIHHLDAPWRPGDVEQRDGRAFRQKNINKEVAKYVYVTKGSFDARLWDILGFKQNFIDQIMNGENVGREVEDTGEVTLSASEIKALASGNPMIKEQVELDTDIKRLENLYMAHNAARIEAKSKLAKAKLQRAEIEQRIEKAKTDLKNRGSGYEDEGFSITIGKRSFDDRKAAGEALMDATAKANKDGYTKIGSFAGFDILAIETNEGFKGLLKGAQGYSFNFYPEQTTRMIGNLQRIVRDLDSYIKQQQERLAEIDKEIKGQEEQISQPFAQQEELDKKRARYTEIMDILNPKEEQAIAEDEGDEDRVEYSLRRTEGESNVKRPTFTEDEMKENARALKRMSVVKELSGKEFAANGKTLFENILDYFTSLGNVVHSDLFGDVALTRSSARSEIRHGTTREKTIAYAALPEVIQNGKVIFTVDKGRGLERIVTAAPIRIEGKKYYMAVMLQRDPNMQRLYAHDVVIEEEPSSADGGHLSTNRAGKNEGTLFITSILHDALSVKGEPRIKQEFSSAATSLNQVAALFKSKYFMPGDINIDIGGGAYNATTEYLAEQYGTANMVFDPYNRGSEENMATLDFLRAGNRADTATCANVLNVIKEAEARRNVILETAKAIKEDGTAYFSVYEKDKSGQGRQTGADQWQNSRATADYVQEIEEFFDNVERKGAVIIATDPKAGLPKAFWRITEEQEIEYANRRDALSNRDVLKMAAAEIDPATLSAAEKNALDMFTTRLDRLEEAQNTRAELGRQYRDEQFTRGGSRAEAQRIRNRMSVYDERINRLENELVSLENKDVLRRVLIEARGVVEQEERKRADENLRRYRARRNESMNTRKYREKVRADAETLRKWLVSPSNKDIRKHVPAQIQKTVADFLDSINLLSKTALASSGLSTTKADEKYLKNMKKLHDAIKENVDVRGLYSGYADLPADFLENFEAMIRKAEQHMEDNPGVFVVNQMNARELKELHQTLKTLKKYITTMNMLHQNAVFAHVDEAGDSTVQHLGKFKKSAKSGAAYKFLRFDYMRPSYAFEHFGEGGKSIEHEFREGQATQAFLANKIIDFAKKTYTGKEVKEWSEEVKEFTLSNGEKIRLPVGQIMSLFELNKRAQGRTHIYGGGVRASNFTEKGKVQLDDGHTLSEEDVQNMLASLTPRQREVANKLQQFMAKECAEWGNYVSLARFDVEQFGEENYFPINSDGRYLPATADESPDNAGLYALLNMGFTKELKENANNRIILYNIFDVFANHAASMTQYRSFALPVLDALKWFNYKNDSTSVRDQLAKAFGAPEESRAGSGSKGYAESFVLNLIRAYNGTAAQGGAYDNLGLKALHRFNRAAIAYNLRVVAQQPTAITRAAMLLSPGKLLRGLGMSAVKMKKLAEEMEQHSGIAAWKQLGFYDTNISRGLTELIKQNNGFEERMMELGTKGAELADRYTWAAMWYAAKQSVQRSAYKSEEDYFKAVTEKFEDVIYKTQVVDSVLTKSEFLREKGFFPRMLGAFMSEPMTTVSMLADAHYKYTDDLQQGMSRSEAWQRNGKNIVKTAAVYAIGQVILAAAQAFMDAWRDDDEYDAENWFSNYFQKWLNAFKANVVEEELIFGKIPLVSELYETMKSLMDYAGLFDKWGLDLYGNDISNGWAQYAKYMTKAAEIILDKTGVTGNKTNYTWYGAIYNLLKFAAGLTGYPAATLWREIQDLWNNTVGYSAPSLKLDTYKRSIDRIYEEKIRPTGISMVQYEKMLDEIDTDKSGNISQSETWPYLLAKINSGELTREQAEAIWNAKGWQSSFEDAIAGYTDYIKPLGISSDKYAEILTAADESGNGSVTQDEMGAYLLEEIKAGRMSEKQADTMWRSLWHKEKSKTFDKWRAAQGAETAPAATTAPAPTPPATTKQTVKAPTVTAAAMPTTVPSAAASTTVSTYEDFKKSAPVYHDKLDSAYSIWQSEVQPRGVSLDQYTGYLRAADTDGNGSVKQDEMGNALVAAIQRGEIDGDTASAIWRTLWNGSRSKTFYKWAGWG